MCEQCTLASAGLMRYRFTIKQCPRLNSLGPATVEWLNRAITDEIEDAIEIEHEGGDSHMSDARTGPVSSRLRLPLAVVLIAILAVGLVGMIRAHVLWEWWRASPSDIMLASVLTAQLLVAVVLIRLLPRSRASDAR